MIAIVLETCPRCDHAQHFAEPNATQCAKCLIVVAWIHPAHRLPGGPAAVLIPPHEYAKRLAAVMSSQTCWANAAAAGEL